MAKRWLVCLGYLLLTTIALASSGCLGLVIGGAAGGAAAGYAFYKRGEWYRDYPAPMKDTAVAVKAALGELQLPILSEKGDEKEIEIDSRTGDNATIHITLTPITSRVPADGPSSHVNIRIGPLGDEDLSRRIHEQVSMHLIAPVQLRPPMPIPAPTTTASSPPSPLHESAAPPLAK